MEGTSGSYWESFCRLVIVSFKALIYCNAFHPFEDSWVFFSLLLHARVILVRIQLEHNQCSRGHWFIYRMGRFFLHTYSEWEATFDEESMSLDREMGSE